MSASSRCSVLDVQRESSTGLGRYGPAVALAVLAPVVAELLSSSAPPSAFFVPWVFALFVLFYGTAALLIRELSVRWGAGQVSVLLMGGAFGILQEGCATRAFFDPAWRSLGPLEGLGRWLGVNWIWTADAILYHAVFSAALPILLVHRLFPESATRTWLKPWELFAMAVLFSLALAIFVGAGSKYPVPGLYLVTAVAIAFGFVALAARLKRKAGSSAVGREVPAKWFGLLAAGATVGQVFQIYFAPQIGGAILSFALLVALVALPCWLLNSWTARGRHFSPRQQYALLAGALGSFAVMDFFQEFNPSRSDNVLGVSIVGACALAGLIWMGRRLKQVSDR